MEGLTPAYLCAGIVVVAWLVFTAGAVFGYWLHGRLHGWADQNLHHELYQRDCQIAELRTRLRMLEPEANPLAWLDIRN